MTAKPMTRRGTSNTLRNTSAPETRLTRLTAEFFRTFARMEYALKAAGYHRGEGDANPDWQRFAVTVEGAVANPDDRRLRAAIDYISQRPPRKQVIRNGQLAWEDAIPQTNSQADLLLLYVRRVRNNLFHGGKFNGHWFEPERSDALIRHSLVILRACRDASDEVTRAYGAD